MNFGLCDGLCHTMGSHDNEKFNLIKKKRILNFQISICNGGHIGKVWLKKNENCLRSSVLKMSAHRILTI